MEVMTRRALGVLLFVIGAVPAAATGFLVPTGSPDPLEVSWQRVEVTIEDQVAITRVRQTFRNNTDSVLEGEYRFTLSAGASVSDFAIWEDGQRVAGVIRRKEDARRIYDHIVNQKRDPGLLEQIAPNIFSARVYPIPAQAEKRIEIEYRELLPLDEGLCLVRVPLVDDQLASPRIGELVVTFEVKDGGRLISAWSPDSALEIHHRDEHSVSASYEARDVQPVQDMVLHYQVVRPQTGYNVLSHREGDTEGYFLLTLNPDDPGMPKREKDVVFVIDVSGSMKGPRMVKAKEALKFCLTLLEPQDRFDLVRFSTDVVRMSSASAGLLPANDREVDRALSWVDGLEARGGTNLEGGLREGLGALEKGPAQRPRYLVVLSDGDPTIGVTHFVDIESSIKKSNTVDARIFTFGIGEVAGSRLLATLSENHRGEALAIRQDEDIESRLPLFFGKLVRPLFDKVEIDWGALGVEEVYPREIPRFYLGRAVSVVGRYRQPANGPVRIRAHVEGRTVDLAGEIELPASGRAAFLPRLWAQRHVAGLLEMSPEGNVAQEVEDEIVRLSSEHVFVTPFTSFIAVPEKEKALLPDELKRKLEADPRGAEERIERLEQEVGNDPENAESHYQLALAYDDSGRQDAARKTFEHARAAMRLDASYKRKLQGTLKNSDVSSRIAQTVHEIIEKTESETLSDETTQKYAEQIQNMLGEKLDADDFRDKDKVRELLEQQGRPDLERLAGESVRGKSTATSSVRGTQIKSVHAAPTPEPGNWSVEEEEYGKFGYDAAPEHDAKTAFVAPKAAEPAQSAMSDDGLADLQKSYVDKLSRVTPDEREKMKESIQKFSGPSGDITEVQKRELLQTSFSPQNETEFNTRLQLMRQWIVLLKRQGKELGDLANIDRKLQTLYYTNRIRAAAGLEKALRTLARLEGLPVPSGGVPEVTAVIPTPTPVPTPGPASMDVAWRGLRAQVASARSRVRWLRTKVEGVERLVAGSNPEELPAAVEAVRVSPSIIQGGQLARFALTLRHTGEVAPRIRWRCREGRFESTAAGAAVWQAPPVPGAYTIEVVMYPAKGDPVHESFEVEVYQPGRITYSAELLDARVSLLDHSLRQLHEEYGQLEGRLDPAKALPATAELLAGLATPEPTLPAGDSPVAEVRHDPQGPYRWTSWLHRIDPDR